MVSPPFLGCFWANPFYTFRTCIKSRTSWNFGQIELLTTELAALEHLKKNILRLIMGKWCLHATCSLFSFDRIIKVAGNQEGIKTRMSSILGRIRPLILELLALENFALLNLEYLWSQLANLDQVLCVASLGWGKGCIRFWGRLDQNSSFYGNRKDTLEFAKEKYFSGHSDTRSIQENFDLLTSFIQHSADKHIPSKTSRSVSSIPWITPEIRRKIRRRNKTHAKAKKTGSSKLRLNLKL